MIEIYIFGAHILLQGDNKIRMKRKWERKRHSKASPFERAGRRERYAANSVKHLEGKAKGVGLLLHEYFVYMPLFLSLSLLCVQICPVKDIWHEGKKRKLLLTRDCDFCNLLVLPLLRFTDGLRKKFTISIVACVYMYICPLERAIINVRRMSHEYIKHIAYLIQTIYIRYIMEKVWSSSFPNRCLYFLSSAFCYLYTTFAILTSKKNEKWRDTWYRK